MVKDIRDWVGPVPPPVNLGKLLRTLWFDFYSGNQCITMFCEDPAGIGFVTQTCWRHPRTEEDACDLLAAIEALADQKSSATFHGRSPEVKAFLESIYSDQKPS